MSVEVRVYRAESPGTTTCWVLSHLLDGGTATRAFFADYAGNSVSGLLRRSQAVQTSVDRLPSCLGNGDERLTSPHDDRLGQVRPVAVTDADRCQQAQPLTGARVNLPDDLPRRLPGGTGG